MKKTKYNLINVKDAPLFVEIEINDKRCAAVVDTGANFVVMDKKFAEENTMCEVDDDGSEMAGVGYSKTFESLSFRCLMALEDVDGNKRGYLLEGTAVDLTDLQSMCAKLIDIPVVAIIGTDWLDYWRANIDVKKKTMTLS